MPAAAQIRTMFSAIAPRYDALNRILSLGIDRSWRRRACEALEAGENDLAADLCCGTGDLALALSRRGASVVAADFSHEMLTLAGAKGVALRIEADCLNLPFPTGTFDLVTVGFGVRNLADLRAGLDEMRRVLRPRGRLGILEFARPRRPLLRGLYHVYLRWAVPPIGALVSGRRNAYQYLSDSIQEFPDQERMTSLIEEAGFEAVRHIDLAGGIAALYLARRA